MKHDHSPNQVRSMMAWAYKKQSPALFPRLLNDLEKLPKSLPSIIERHLSTDGTQKILFATEDGLKVESVILNYHRKLTVCLSTQVGCAMGCTFCRTGMAGLGRNLEAYEIVGMYLHLRNLIWHENSMEAPCPNIVFMGQGEPLHNFEQVKRALEILTHPWALDLGSRQITLSTVGYLPGLRRFHELPRVNLAFSLHSPFEEERRQLIPIETRYPLPEIQQVLKSMSLLPRQFITLEYLILKDMNHSERHALALADWCRNMKSIVNLIPYNAVTGLSFERPSEEAVDLFKKSLVDLGVRVMERVARGSDIAAACGQLASRDYSSEAP
ncbi:MAG: 23S rRNA (adenine(2503)-C(2))-methyltransferase RlmN [Bdellovibrio sp.]|nr:23S rRNA (adenine(2503)-C(2))-methyltransferase RlmN [Bdellovibrio sp.]